MATLYVYSRRGCHLCEVLIEVRDIDSREDWRERYDSRVPVVEFDGRLVCEYTLDRDAVEAVIAQRLGNSGGATMTTQQ